MDDLLGFIIFAVIFIVGPLLEQLRKKQQPPQQRPPVRVPQAPQQQPLPRSTTEEVSAKPRESAAVMVPDDLWQVLTGEARPAPVPAPKPASKQRPWDVVYIPPEETEDEEETFVENVNVELERTTREAVRREHAQRHKPVEAQSLEVTQANIISLETPVPSSRARHRAFHEKIDKKPVAKAAYKPLFFGTVEELRRGFIMQEILGKPRGLE